MRCGNFINRDTPGDDIPESAVGCCIAFADKVDTLVGIFAIGAVPTGDKDPYALRRAALGGLRIAIEQIQPSTCRIRSRSRVTGMPTSWPPKASLKH